MFSLRLSAARFAAAVATLCVLPVCAQVTPNSLITRFPLSN